MRAPVLYHVMLCFKLTTSVVVFFSSKGPTADMTWQVLLELLNRKIRRTHAKTDKQHLLNQLKAFHA